MLQGLCRFGIELGSTPEMANQKKSYNRVNLEEDSR